MDIKEFKEETHKLQRFDLLEMVTQSSIFADYTVVQLTDKGKELYFGEDASLYIEKPEKNDLICASDIKEKHFFFQRKNSHSSILSTIHFKILITTIWSADLKTKDCQREW